MKKENITISMEGDKLRATKRYMAKKEANLQGELEDALQKLYEKYVPAPVREYIDEGGEDSAATAPTTKNQKDKSKVATAANNGAMTTNL